MEHILRLHANLLFTILLVFGLIGLWALILGLLRRPIGQWLHSGMAIGVLLIVAECILGAIVIVQGLRPIRTEMHILYGIIALLTIPIAHSSARNREARSQGLIYAFACMCVCVFVLRAVEMARL
jgi:CDP-diglyceride synthetase